MDTKQHALAAEVRAEMAVQQIKPNAMQRQVGVSSSAWHNYFVKCSRDVPMSVVVAVAEALGMAGSELLARAEARAGAPSNSPVDPIRDELESKLTGGAKRQVQRAREAEAGEGRVDPRHLSRVDEDDGRTVESLVG